MLDTVRRLIVILMLAVAVLGLMPLVPVVLGYKTATVLENTNTGGTGSVGGTMTYPATNAATALIFCTQNPASISIKKSSNTPLGNKYVKCTNNWGSNVTLTWVIVSGGGGAVTLTNPAATTTLTAGGPATCVPLQLTVTGATGTYPLVYKGFTNTPNDLYLEIQFTGTVVITNAGTNSPTQCA